MSFATSLRAEPVALGSSQQARDQGRRFTELRFAACVAAFLALTLYVIWALASRPLDADAGTATGPVHYAGCDAAHAAGAAPLHRGDPGYREELDADGDGVACAPHRSARIHDLVARPTTSLFRDRRR